MIDNTNFYLVRFDNVTFEYVAKLKAFSYSATFDRAGDFLMITQDARLLYRYQEVHDLAGFTDKSQATDYSADSAVYDYSKNLTRKNER